MVNYMAFLTNAAYGFIAILIVGLIGFLIFVWLQRKQYDTEVILREVRNGRTVIRHGKAKLLEPDSGNKFYQVKYRKHGLFQEKDKIPIPASKAIDTTVDGKKFVEFFVREDGDYIPITFQFDQEEFEDEVDESYEPFTSGQRSMLINELKHADQYGANKLVNAIKENMPIFAVVILIIGLVIFTPDVISEFNTIVTNLQGVSEQLGETVNRVDQLVNNKQVISQAAENTTNATGNATRVVSGG